MSALIAVSLCAIFAPALQELPSLPDLALADLALADIPLADIPRWREHVRPSSDELGFEALPWIASFSEGLKRAHEEGRPLLFWAMNGHPLGCT